LFVRENYELEEIERSYISAYKNVLPKKLCRDFYIFTASVNRKLKIIPMPQMEKCVEFFIQQSVMNEITITCDSRERRVTLAFKYPALVMHNYNLKLFSRELMSTSQSSCCSCQSEAVRSWQQLSDSYKTYVLIAASHAYKPLENMR
jgi:hypothetical protein